MCVNTVRRQGITFKERQGLCLTAKLVDKPGCDGEDGGSQRVTVPTHTPSEGRGGGFRHPWRRPAGNQRGPSPWRSRAGGRTGNQGCAMRTCQHTIRCPSLGVASRILAPGGREDDPPELSACKTVGRCGKHPTSCWPSESCLSLGVVMPRLVTSTASQLHWAATSLAIRCFSNSPVTHTLILVALAACPRHWLPRGRPRAGTA